MVTAPEPSIAGDASADPGPGRPGADRLRCDGCGARLRLPPHIRASSCPFCDAHVIVEGAGPAGPTPKLALGFAVDQKAALERVEEWLSRQSFFSASGFRSTTPQKTLGVYLPVYLYGVRAESAYEAEIGEEYRKRDLTNNKTETKTEWRHLQGLHGFYVQDVLVSASSAVDNEHLEAIEPFPLGELRPFGAELVSGWLAEDPTRSEAECFQFAHHEAESMVRRRLGRFMPGDRHRKLAHRTELHHETIDLVLVPVWTFASRYDDKRPPVQILVNGCTGKVFGEVPKSWFKILLVVGGVLGLILLIATLVAVGIDSGVIR